MSKDKKEKQEEIERTIMDKFLEFLRYFFTKDMPENAPAELEKERLYLINFLFEQFKRVYTQYYDNNIVPIFEFTLYGNHVGKTIYEYNCSPDPLTIKGYRLSEFAQKFEEMIKDWDKLMIEKYGQKDDIEVDISIVDAWRNIKNIKKK